MPRDATKQIGAGAPPTKGARLACFEWIRAVGCVAIVLLHVFVSLHNAVGREALGPARVLAEDLVMAVFTRWAVPCFLMVSGALLLDPKRRVTWESVRRYVVRMLFVLATFGLFFCLMESAYTHRGISLGVLGEALLNLVTGNSWGHLWYVYAMVFLYALTPALRRLVRSVSDRALFVGLAAYYVVALVIPTGIWAQGIYPSTPFNLVAALFYFVLGWVVRRYFALGPVTVLAGVASLAALVVACVLGYAELTLPEFCLVAPYAVLVFLLFSTYATLPIERVPAVALLADYSFGIYVIHPLFLHVLTRVVDLLAIPVGLYELLAFALALGGSVASVWLVRRVPGFKQRI